MSRGLGKLQREIIETLDKAKQKEHYYRGHLFSLVMPIEDEPGWVVIRGHAVRVADHVYDLRASLQYLARKRGEFSHMNYVTMSFTSNFYRAVKSLVKRGILKKLEFIPLQSLSIDYDKDQSWYSLGRDGVWYFQPHLRQIRFVTLENKC